MNTGRQKHKLLKILSKQYALSWQSDNEPHGLTEEEIIKQLSIDDYELKIIITDLCTNNETQHYKPDEISGWAATKDGIISYNTKKYIHANNKLIWDIVKNWTQTLIPILSLIIAILAIKSDNEAINKELEELRVELSHIKESAHIIQSQNSQNLELDSLLTE